MPNLVNLLKCMLEHLLLATSEYILYDISVGQCVLLAEADCEKDLELESGFPVI